MVFLFFYSVPGGRVKLTIPLQSDSVGVTIDTPLDLTKESNALTYFTGKSSNGMDTITKENFLYLLNPFIPSYETELFLALAAPQKSSRVKKQTNIQIFLLLLTFKNLKESS